MDPEQTPREEVDFGSLYCDFLSSRTPLAIEMYDSRVPNAQPPLPRLPFHALKSGYSWYERLERARDALPRSAFKPARPRIYVKNSASEMGSSSGNTARTVLALEVPQKRGRGRPRKSGSAAFDVANVHSGGAIDLGRVGVGRSDFHYIRRWSQTEIGCEYDLDAQDFEWLKLFNSAWNERTGYELQPDALEHIIETLELGWDSLTHPHRKLQQRRESTAYPDEMPCEICGESDTSNCNVIVLCDDCDLAVHQECYGVPHIPEGPWLCRTCGEQARYRMSVAPKCMLCPWPRGALRKTSDHRWVHVICAHMIPETQDSFAVSSPTDLVDVSSLDEGRARLRCVLCRLDHAHGGGYPIQCSSKFCSVAFHALCARKAEWPLFFHKQEAFCAKHAEDEAAGIEQSEQESTSKAPLRLRIDLKGAIGNVDGCQPVLKPPSSPPHNPSPSVSPKPGNGGGNGRWPVVDVTDSPPLHFSRSAGDKMRLETVAPRTLIDFVSREHASVPRAVIEAIGRYWSLKREARRGTPLLKSLLIEPIWDGAEEMNADNLALELRRRRFLRDQVRRLRRLLHCLQARERAKLEAFRGASEMFALVARPFYRMAKRAITRLQELADPEGFFALPVPVDEYPDYPTVVSHPMDFATILRNLILDERSPFGAELFYPTLAHLFADIQLVSHNAQLYNMEASVYYEAAGYLAECARFLLADLEARMAVLGVFGPNDILRVNSNDAEEPVPLMAWPREVPQATPLRLPHKYPRPTQPLRAAGSSMTASQTLSWSSESSDSSPERSAKRRRSRRAE